MNAMKTKHSIMTKGISILLSLIMLVSAASVAVSATENQEATQSGQTQATEQILNTGEPIYNKPEGTQEERDAEIRDFLARQEETYQENEDAIAQREAAADEEAGIMPLMEMGGLENGKAYYLVNVYSGKVLDVYDSQTAIRTNVMQYAKLGGKNQQFTLEFIDGPGGDDYYKFHPGHAPGMVLDVKTDVPSNGQRANIQLFDDIYPDAQQFKIRYEENGEYSIYWERAGVNYYFSVDDGSNGSRHSFFDDRSMATGNVYVAPFHKADKTMQRWRFIEVSDSRPIKDGTYFLKNLNRDNVEDLYMQANPSAGSQLIQKSYNYAEEKWLLEYISDGYYTIQSARNPNLYVTCENDWGTNGNRIILDTIKHNGSQLWRITPNAVLGGYRITPMLVYNRKAIAIEGASTTSGGKAILWDYNAYNEDKGNDHWAVESCHIANGAYTLVNRNSNPMVLDAYNFQTSNGTKVQQWSPTGSANQAFVFTYRGGGYYSIAASYAESMVLTVEGSTSPSIQGNMVRLYQWTGSATQLWKIEKTNSGYYALYNKAGTGECLAIQNASKSITANALTWRMGNGWNDHWALKDVDIAGIMVSTVSVKVEIGKTFSGLNASVLPSTAMNKGITYTSANSNIARVSSSGVITGVGEGTTTIRVASVADPSKAVTITVKVYEYVPYSQVMSPIWQTTDQNYSDAVQTMLLELNFDWYFAESTADKNAKVARANEIRRDVASGLGWWLDESKKISEAAANEFSWFLGGSVTTNDRDEWLELNKIFKEDFTINDTGWREASMFILGLLSPEDMAENGLRSFIIPSTMEVVSKKFGQKGTKAFIKAMKNGIVRSEGSQGIKVINATLKNGKKYKYELKILNNLGDYRLVGNFDEKSKHILFEALVKHSDFK